MKGIIEGLHLKEAGFISGENSSVEAVTTKGSLVYATIGTA